MNVHGGTPINKTAACGDVTEQWGTLRVGETPKPTITEQLTFLQASQDLSHSIIRCEGWEMQGVSSGEDAENVPIALNTRRQLIGNMDRWSVPAAIVHLELTRISQQNKRGAISPHHLLLQAQLSQTSVFHRSPWPPLVVVLSTGVHCAHILAATSRWSLTSTLEPSFLAAAFTCTLHYQTPVLCITVQLVHTIPVITSM